MTKKSLSSNPVRKYRNQAGMTQHTMATRCNISVQALYMTENGVYEKIPEGITDFMGRKDVDLESLAEEYSKFRLKMAMANARVWETLPFFLPPVDLSVNPIKEFREKVLKLASNALCVQFLVNPGIYRRVEETLDYTNIPETVVQALISGGVPADIVEELQERFREYSEFKRYRS